MQGSREKSHSDANTLRHVIMLFFNFFPIFVGMQAELSHENMRKDEPKKKSEVMTLLQQMLGRI